jgi:hypothetical protein
VVGHVLGEVVALLRRAVLLDGDRAVVDRGRVLLVELRDSLGGRIEGPAPQVTRDLLAARTTILGDLNRELYFGISTAMSLGVEKGRFLLQGEWNPTQFLTGRFHRLTIPVVNIRGDGTLKVDPPRRMFDFHGGISQRQSNRFSYSVAAGGRLRIGLVGAADLHGQVAENSQKKKMIFS